MDLSDLDVVTYPAIGAQVGPPIVLVHGAWHAAWCWNDGFAQRLASRGHDVFALNLRGHGPGTSLRGRWRLRVRDHVADLRGVVEALDRSVILVGHSRGGFIVQKYLESHDAAGAVLLAPMPHFGMRACMARMLRMAPWAVLRMHATFGAAAPTRAAARRLLFSLGMPAAEVRRHHSRMQGEAFIAYLDLMGLDLCRPRKGAAPTLVLAAGEDAMFTREEVEAVAIAHDAVFDVTPCMAHDMMLEPGWETVADRVAAWAVRCAEPQGQGELIFGRAEAA